MTAINGKNNYYRVQIDVGKFNWGKNTLKYKLVDKADNTTEGTLDFNPSFSSITGIIHNCLTDITFNSNTFTAKMGIINSNNGYTYGDRINESDSKSELKVF
ncbi:MAG: hypothetical protein K5907_07555, partial [Treponema sp.]|nr:hypothetical protein [Treponema sp.]